MFEEVSENEEKDISALELAKNILAKRQQAYHQVFNSDKGVFLETVLGDLARFCRAEKTTFHEDPRIHAALEGRREVWLRIQHHLKLDSAELEKLYLNWNN